ncbi:hypothetical protein L198_00387 [Cryptococcus wingfieldii CBS 7118]|uniref:Uncharacterized protein n=1 Tax=Cryptococcus wingfieldii CBS 7118 TaxID=1295528 RepID=A0A1E3K6M9_9TREE|nr:hypothetical protein L198_00387 [Cryptococcus wingfieldii CBS 7118]ODO08655.1 hypothetical protein L198_00387 [Cryptococcus wingfieldii CBS 7118]
MRDHDAVRASSGEEQVFISPYTSTPCDTGISLPAAGLCASDSPHGALSPVTSSLGWPDDAWAASVSVRPQASGLSAPAPLRDGGGMAGEGQKAGGRKLRSLVK